MSTPGTRDSKPAGESPGVRTDDDPLRTAPYESVDASTDAPGQFLIGSLLQGRYEVERVLGSGGMGQVFLARDLTLDRPVALKVIRPRDPRLRDRTVCDTALRDAFAAEARIGAGLTHPAIATVHDFGFHDGEPFIVFEYIGGETLREVLRRRGCLPVDEARLILGPLAQALDFAHARHVVHRDLKPENIRSTGQGHFKILDLGLAQEFHRAADWRFAGTPAYTAPEQAAGLPCDGRADQYALAVMAQEVLTGRRVFDHPDVEELLRLQREQAPPDPRAAAPDLPDEVRAALARALDKDPNRRFASCEEFAVALGCRFVSAPGTLPSVLRFAAARSMSIQWGMTLRFVYLVLGEDALWTSHYGEMLHWPLDALKVVRRSWWGNKLHLSVAGAGKPTGLTFHFAGRQECREWHDHLTALTSNQTPGRTSAEVPDRVQPVVLLRRRPEMRHQALGAVEFHDARRGRARAGLQLRAAMMGADAVVDVQDERLPG
jgi:serine/threonine-protein kinase